MSQNVKSQNTRIYTKTNTKIETFHKKSQKEKGPNGKLTEIRPNKNKRSNPKNEQLWKANNDIRYTFYENQPWRDGYHQLTKKGKRAKSPNQSATGRLLDPQNDEKPQPPVPFHSMRRLWSPSPRAPGLFPTNYQLEAQILQDPATQKLIKIVYILRNGHRTPTSKRLTRAKTQERGRIYGFKQTTDKVGEIMGTKGEKIRKKNCWENRNREKIAGKWAGKSGKMIRMELENQAGIKLKFREWWEYYALRPHDQLYVFICFFLFSFFFFF